MFGTTNFSTILLHIYIITYLIVTISNAPDMVMQIIHIICPFVVIPFVYYTIKSSATAASSTEEKKERYEAL